MKGKKAVAGTRLKEVIRDAIEDFQPVAHCGVAVAILQNGGIAFSGGFGWRNRERKKKVTARTVFPIGSATKAFNSVMLSIHAAASQGHLTLDMPVTDYAPDFAMQQAKPTIEMTLVDVLSHQTGLPRNDALWCLGPFSRSQLYFRLRGLAQISGAFRALFLYNNLMYMTAGHILEYLTGSTWEALVKQAVLDRLGMADTSFTLDDLLRNPNRANGYENDVPVPLKDYANIGPAGEMNSTVLDLATWVQLFLDKGRMLSGSVLLDEASVERLYADLIDTGDGQVFYGLGWYVGTLQKRRYIFHDGVADGFTSYVSFMPDQKLGVILLTNQHSNIFITPLGSMWPRKVAERIYGYLITGRSDTGITLPQFPDSGGLLDLPAASIPTGHSPSGSTRTDKGVAGKDQAGGPCGLYSDASYGDMTISRKGGGLELSYYGWTWPLLLAEDTFYFKLYVSGATHTLKGSFVKDGSGNVNALMIKLTQEAQACPVVFLKR